MCRVMYHHGDKLRAIKEMVRLNSLAGKTDAGLEYT